MHDSIWYNRASFVYSVDTEFQHGWGSQHHLVVINIILDMSVVYFVSGGERGLDRVNSLPNISVEPLSIQEEKDGHIIKITSHMMFQSTLHCMYGSVPISL